MPQRSADRTVACAASRRGILPVAGCRVDSAALADTVGRGPSHRVTRHATHV